MTTLNIFQIGETVVIKATITKSSVAYDPTTSIKVALYTSANTVDTAAVDMVKEGTGIYTYNWQAAAKTADTYKIVVTAIDGATKITIKKAQFRLEVV
jgi:hypothetical protein